MTNLETTNSENQNSSPSSSSKTPLALKILEYLSLAAFVCTTIIALVVPDNQTVVVWLASSLALFIFLALTNKQLSQNYRNSAYQSDISQKAELYTYLGFNNNSAQTKPLTPVRQKALQYCQDLIRDYKQTRNNSRNIYYSLQIATVVLSGITPIFVLVDKLDIGIVWLNWLPVIFPAVASIVASVVTSFPFQENWISANATVEKLEAEQEKFVLGVGQLYRCYDSTDEIQSVQKSKKAIENFITQVNNIHLNQLQGSDENKPGEEKPDTAIAAEKN